MKANLNQTMEITANLILEFNKLPETDLGNIYNIDFVNEITKEYFDIKCATYDRTYAISEIFNSDIKEFKITNQIHVKDLVFDKFDNIQHTFLELKKDLVLRIDSYKPVILIDGTKIESYNIYAYNQIKGGDMAILDSNINGEKLERILRVFTT